MYVCMYVFIYIYIYNIYTVTKLAVQHYCPAAWKQILNLKLYRLSILPIILSTEQIYLPVISPTLAILCYGHNPHAIRIHISIAKVYI